MYTRNNLQNLLSCKNTSNSLRQRLLRSSVGLSFLANATTYLANVLGSASHLKSPPHCFIAQSVKFIYFHDKLFRICVFYTHEHTWSPQSASVKKQHCTVDFASVLSFKSLCIDYLHRCQGLGEPYLQCFKIFYFVFCHFCLLWTSGYCKISVNHGFTFQIIFPRRVFNMAAFLEISGFLVHHHMSRILFPTKIQIRVILIKNHLYKK